MADKFKRYGIPVRLENTPDFKKLLDTFISKTESENAFVAKQTTTSGTKVYTFTAAGDASLPVMSNASTGSTPPTGAVIPITSGGKIKCADPDDDYFAANKKYVDEQIAALRAELSGQ